MRKISSNVRGVLTSSYNEQEATRKFSGKGLAGSIQKPYRPEKLIAMIAEILQQSEKRAA